MQSPMIEKLQEFGLSEKEAQVYFASLEIGNATADQVSKQAGVNRSTTYVQIEQLMEMGLMSTHEVGKKTMFSAESPDNLKRLFERQQETLKLQSKALDAFIPELGQIFEGAGERPAVRFFQGKEGLITMRNEVLKVKNKQIMMAFSFDHLWEVFTDDMDTLYAWSAERAKKKISSQIIYTKTGDPVEAVALQELYRVSEADFPFESDVYVFDNKVAMASMKGTVVGVIVESESIANTMRSILQLAITAAKQ